MHARTQARTVREEGRERELWEKGRKGEGMGSTVYSMKGVAGGKRFHATTVLLKRCEKKGTQPLPLRPSCLPSLPSPLFHDVKLNFSPFFCLGCCMHFIFCTSKLFHSSRLIPTSPLGVPNTIFKNDFEFSRHSY